MKTIDWIRESNLIEDIDDPKEDQRSYRAWLWFKKQPLTLENILKLHRKITFKQLEKYDRGFWRDCQVWVGGREGVRWEAIPGAMAEWLRHNKTAHKKWTIQESHVAFEHIHPFIDGNGRTGRMIMNHQRMSEGMSPLCIKASERWAYYDWF